MSNRYYKAITKKDIEEYNFKRSQSTIKDISKTNSDIIDVSNYNMSHLVTFFKTIV